MKKLLVIAFLLSLSLTSCVRKPCWKCIITTETTPNGVVIQPQVRTEFICGKSYWEIKRYEREQSSVQVHDLVTVTTVVDCTEGDDRTEDGNAN